MGVRVDGGEGPKAGDLEDIDRSYSVTVAGEGALVALVVPPVGAVACGARRTGLGGVGLVNMGGGHPGLVGQVVFLAAA